VKFSRFVFQLLFHADEMARCLDVAQKNGQDLPVEKIL